MPRPSAAATRDRLLRAAAAEIIVEGYAGATLSSIAARLGMTKGSLAYHFPSKSDVAHALLDHMSDAYAELRSSVRADGLRGSRALIVLLARIGLRTRTDSLFTAANALIMTPGVLHFTLPNVLGELIDTYAEYLQEAVDDGETRPGIDVVESAEDILAGSIGVMVLFSRHPERQGPRPMRLTRRQLAAIGIEHADALVDEMLALELAQPAR